MKKEDDNEILIEKKKFQRSLLLYTRDVRYIYCHPSSSTFIGEFFRKSFLPTFFFVPSGRASERRFYCQPSHVQTVSSRNSIAFRAAHKHGCTREVSPGDPFGFFHLFISDKSLACDNFVSRKVFRLARIGVCATSGFSSLSPLFRLLLLLFDSPLTTTCFSSLSRGFNWLLWRK